MSLALVCTSHSPLLEHAEPPAEVVDAVRGAFARSASTSPASVS